MKKKMDIDINSIEMVYNSIFEDYIFTEKFKISVKKFIKLLGIDIVSDAMETACSKIRHEDKALKYFCGICWNIIKEK